jgi:hypothetical protein
MMILDGTTYCFETKEVDDLTIDLTTYVPSLFHYRTEPILSL